MIVHDAPLAIGDERVCAYEIFRASRRRPRASREALVSEHDACRDACRDACVEDHVD